MSGRYVQLGRLDVNETFEGGQVWLGRGKWDRKKSELSLGADQGRPVAISGRIEVRLGGVVDGKVNL